MKRVLVLGATGAMGRYLVPYLSEKGYQVDAVALDDAPSAYDNVKHMKANAKDDEVLGELLTEKYDAVVDFMLYFTAEFEKRYKMILENTKHYIFFSSYRVYADEETPIKETSPRLLETTEDKEFLEREKFEYALYKARQEDILRNSRYKNWTILRPSMIYSTYRYQLVGLEAGTFMYRIQNKKVVVLPESAMNKHAAMTWSGDAAKMIEGVLLNERAYGEIYTMGSGEQNTWADVLKVYKENLDFECILVSDEEYKKIFMAEDTPSGISEWYKHIYDRFYDRAIDNSKILEVAGIKQNDFMLLKDGLKKEIASIDKNFRWWESDISVSMDKYIEE